MPAMPSFGYSRQAHFVPHDLPRGRVLSGFSVGLPLQEFVLRADLAGWKGRRGKSNCPFTYKAAQIFVV